MKTIEAAGLVASSFRTLPRFKVVRASSVAEASEALASSPTAVVLAGGTDLPARFNEGFAPTVVVDISRVAELKQVEARDSALHIGAGVTHAAGSTHPLVREKLPSFAAAWARIANVRIRMSATIGGNLMARRTRYEGAILLSALGARLQLLNSGRAIELDVTDTFDTPAGAFLTGIVIPLRPGLRLDYERSMRPVMTQAVALDSHGDGRVVTATEFVKPRVLALSASKVTHGGSAPETFGDPVASDAYIARMRNVFLQRQLARMVTA